MAINLNFTGVEAKQGGEIIAEGEYRCVIDSAGEKTASTGTPGVEVALRIVGGDFDGRFVWGWPSGSSRPPACRSPKALSR